MWTWLKKKKNQQTDHPKLITGVLVILLVCEYSTCELTLKIICYARANSGVSLVVKEMILFVEMSQML